MSDFLEERLRKALGRQEPPEGFAERMLAKVPAHRPGRSRFSYVAVAATLILALLFGGMEWRRQQQVKEQNARETERQVVFALALAMQKFEHVNNQLQQSAAKVKVDEKRGNL
jgi:hypothetical protein